jgi:hypothetical protein
LIAGDDEKDEQQQQQQQRQHQTPIHSLSRNDIYQGLIAMNQVPLYKPATNDDPTSWQDMLYSRLDKIRYVCGELCTINDQTSYEKYSTVDPISNATIIKIPQNASSFCPSILGLEEIDIGDPQHCLNMSSDPSNQSRKPKVLMSGGYYPTELFQYYTMDGMYPFHKAPGWCEIYLTSDAGDTTLWSTGNVWTKQGIENAIQEIQLGKHHGSYGVESVRHVYTFLRKYQGAVIPNQSVLVIGSSAPWLEAILLLLGASRVTTLEYGTLISEHPQIVTMTPETFRQQYYDGTLELFDAVVTHSVSACYTNTFCCGGEREKERL